MDVKPVEWLGDSKDALRAFPEIVKDNIGYALWVAQIGDKHPGAKPLQGFGGAGVLEVVEDFRGDTFRAVYTVKFAERIYVLHVFQKKSKRETRRRDRALIESRLALAAADDERRRRQVR